MYTYIKVHIISYYILPHTHTYTRTHARTHAHIYKGRILFRRAKDDF